MNNQVALVTGANGFIGSHLCELLSKSGYQVRALVRKTSNLENLKGLSLELAFGELSDPASLNQVLQKVDFVFHPAGLVKAKDRQTFFRVNQLGTRNLVEAIAKVSPGLKRFVHISSQAAAGPAESHVPIIESDPPRPITHYGASKLASEVEVLKYRTSLPVTIIRPPAVYGPRDIDVFQFFRMAKMGLNLKLGKTPKYVSIVHVSDLVKAVLLAAENDKARGEIFFAANREIYLIDDLIGSMGKIMNKKLIKMAIPIWMAKALAFSVEKSSRWLGKIPMISRDKLDEFSRSYWICSSEKISRLLGWQAEISIEQGFEQTYQWYKERKWL